MDIVIVVMIAVRALTGWHYAAMAGRQAPAP